jgi:hypothetical protein
MKRQRRRGALDPSDRAKPFLRSRNVNLASLFVAVLAILGVVAWRAVVETERRAGATTTYPPALVAAAKVFEAATASGGTGYRFDVVQRQVEYPRPSGPLPAVVDPSSPTTILRRADHLFVNSIVSRGRVSPSAFWMEMRFGPDEDQVGTFDLAPSMFGVIVKGGQMWRNDGAGWFPTDVSPGAGMDPGTASKLPDLLRNLKNARDLGTGAGADATLRHFSGAVDIANFPGVVASDGAKFTESPVAVHLWVDEQDRLVRLEARARNLNEPTFELRIDTVVSFTYQAAGIAPDPSPAAPSSPIPQP